MQCSPQPVRRSTPVRASRSVTQSLYSVTMYTEAAARLMTAGQESAAAEYLRDAGDTAQEALREMRLLIYQRRPPVLEKGGLAVALQVRLHFGKATTRLEVQDEGVGFERATVASGGGLGLPGMRERVCRIGGRLSIDSAPGRGTRVVVEVPTGGGG